MAVAVAVVVSVAVVAVAAAVVVDPGFMHQLPVEDFTIGLYCQRAAICSTCAKAALRAESSVKRLP